MKTFEYWVDYYEKHSGEKYRQDPNCKLFFIPDRGFSEIKITDGLLIFHQLSGDAKFWHDFGYAMCQALGIKAMGTICIRNIKAYIRMWGYRITKEVELEDGNIQYFAEHKKYGWKGRCSPAWKNAEGTTAYYVTEYLEEGDDHIA